MLANLITSMCVYVCILVKFPKYRGMARNGVRYGLFPNLRKILGDIYVIKFNPSLVHDEDDY